MSQLLTFVEPSIHYSMSKLMTFVESTQLNNFYTFKLCCDKSDLYLPYDIWKLVIYELCDNQTVPVAPIKILEWIDDYITNPLQQKLNPVLLGCDNSIHTPIIYLLYDSVHQPVQMSYAIHAIKLENNQCHIRYYGDFLLGIVKNKSINSIKIDSETPLKPEWDGLKINLTYSKKDFYEFQLTNVYTHLEKEILENTFSLFQDKYRNKNQITYWTRRDIFPFCCVNGYGTHLAFTFETDSPLAQVEFLYAYLNTPIREELKDNKCLKYKKMIYNEHFYQYEY